MEARPLMPRTSMFLKWLPCWLGLSHVNTNFVDLPPVRARPAVMARITNARRFNLASRQVAEIEDWNCGWRNVSREASGRDGMFWNGYVGLVGRACCNVEEQFRGRGEDLAELVTTCGAD